MVNEGMPANYDRGLAICFDDFGKYIGVRVKMGNRDVVYRPGPSNNGPPLTPSAKLSDKLEKKIDFIFQVSESLSHLDSSSNEEWKEWLTRVPWKDEQIQQQVAAEVSKTAEEAGCGEKLESGRTRSGYMFPARFVNGDIQPLFKTQQAKDYMIQETVKVWSKESEQARCSICNSSDTKVFGNFSELKSYSLDKPGSIVGGFQSAVSPRNFPVCSNCSFSLTAAIRYVFDHLQGNMAGESYLILPFSSSLEIRKLLREELEKRPERFSISSRTDLLAASEEEFVQLMLDENLKEQLAFSLIFFAEKQKSWRILGEVHQVLPGRMREIQWAIRRVRSDSMLEGKDGQPLNITSHMLREFTGPENKKSGEMLRSWLSAIFSGRTSDRSVFLGALVERIMAAGRREPQKLAWITRQAWGIYLFAREINFIEQRREESMAFEEPKSSFGQFIKNHNDFFSRTEIATAFLTGCYVSIVCSVQRKERGSDPFSKKFLGRLLTSAALKKLYREGHDKLAQYRKLGYVATTLDPDLAESWVACCNQWRISDEEATFAFTIGYTLAYRIGKEYKIEPIDEFEGDPEEVLQTEKEDEE